VTSPSAPRTPPRARSDALWARAERLIPCGTQTLSKAPDQFVRGVYPIYLAEGRGCRVIDVDGTEYIDYPMALGAILLGHAYPRVVEAVAAQARRGSLFSLMHPLEVEVAERLVDLVPCAEMVRFMKNGSDATSAAVRVARAYTGRERVAYGGYHGWHDWYAVTTPRRAGVPGCLEPLALPFTYNRLDTLEAIFAAHPREVAAVILEQGGEAPAPGFLEGVAALCRRHGAVFVWDEIVTGFRYAVGGAQELYGVTPDLACFGKAMANGLPLAALVGRRELMRTLERAFVSTTFGGETLSLAAARATIDEVVERRVVPFLWRQGERLIAGLRAAAAAGGVDVAVCGAPPRSSLAFADQTGCTADQVRSLFLQEAVKRGVLFGAPIFVSFSHGDDDVEHTVAVCAAAFEVVGRALARGDLPGRLEGAVAGAVFRPAAPVAAAGAAGEAHA
jgi:glutamate-1-semialdehyde aminotransferase